MCMVVINFVVCIPFFRIASSCVVKVGLFRHTKSSLVLPTSQIYNKWDCGLRYAQ